MEGLLQGGTVSASLVFDAVTVLVVLVFVAVNAKRGFSKIFISVVGYVLAIVLGCVAADAGAEPIYDSVIRASTVSDIEDVLSSRDVSQTIRDNVKEATYGVTISEDKLSKVIASPTGIYNLINGSDGSEMLSSDEIVLLLSDSIDEAIGDSLRSVLPGSAVDYMVNSMRSDSGTLYETASTILLQDDEAAAEYLEETFVRPIVVYIVKMATFFIVFFIVMVVVKLVAKTVESNDASVSIVGATDRVLGGLLGLVEAVVLLVLVTVVLRLVVTSNASTSSVFSDEAIQNTLVFKYIYDFEVFTVLK